MEQVPSNSTEPLGVSVLKSHGLFPEANWYWIGVAALIGFMFLFNFLFTLALKYLDRKHHLYMLWSVFKLMMIIILIFGFIICCSIWKASGSTIRREHS